MKKLSWFNKSVYFLNLIVAALLLIACAVPYLTDQYFSFLSFLSLTVPLLVIINFLFLSYWLLQKKRQILISLFVLLIGFFSLGTFVKINLSNKVSTISDLKVMSYNIHGFKAFENMDRLTIYNKLKDFIAAENPDVISFQEVSYRMNGNFMNYPYSFLKRIPTGDKVHLGIFSKYPILKAEIIHFPNSINNGSYADILFKKDTIRIYNIHIQSLGITPGTGNVRSKTPEQLYDKLSTRFHRQLSQAKMIESHRATTDFPTIICTDMNNTQFSNVYQVLKGKSLDTFLEEGAGLGRTYNLMGLPLRIDFIFADDHFEILSHKNYDDKFSDHFPVMASFRLKH